MNVKRIVLVALALTICLGAGSAYGQTNWLGTVDQDWTNDLNWTAGAPMTTSDPWAYIDSNGSGGPVLDTTAATTWVLTAAAGGTNLEVAASGDLTSTGDFDIGYAGGASGQVDNYGAITASRMQVGRLGTGVFNMHGGTVDVTNMNVGRGGSAIGVVNVYDGAITIDDLLRLGGDEPGQGVMNIYGGTVTTAGMYVGQNYNGVLNIYDGSMTTTTGAWDIWGPTPGPGLPDSINIGGPGRWYLTGDQVAIVIGKATQLPEPRIFPMDPAEEIAAFYDPVTNMTTVYETPEPGTLVLLAGVLLMVGLRRRLFS